jgi:hypothetical protein
LREQTVNLPWIDSDRETQEFINFWFGSEQRKSLRALAWLVAQNRGPLRDALRLAISKIIITKKPCASLARDTSHSRPHRVTDTSYFDVIEGFRKAVGQIARELERIPSLGTVIARRADARQMPDWLVAQADIVVTSPPYGNAIDYLRGHRLALVWLGYTIPQLRAIRTRSVGSERKVGFKRCTGHLKGLAQQLGPIGELDNSTQCRLYRYAQDMLLVLHQVYCALKSQKRAVLVVGNSSVKGVFLDNTRMISAAAERFGFREVYRYSREIPANHRYLPPPRAEGDEALGKRIREEVVLTFEKTP